MTPRPRRRHHGSTAFGLGSSNPGLKQKKHLFLAYFGLFSGFGGTPYFCPSCLILKSEDWEPGGQLPTTSKQSSASQLSPGRHDRPPCVGKGTTAHRGIIIKDRGRDRPWAQTGPGPKRTPELEKPGLLPMRPLNSSAMKMGPALGQRKTDRRPNGLRTCMSHGGDRGHRRLGTSR